MGGLLNQFPQEGVQDDGSMQPQRQGGITPFGQRSPQDQVMSIAGLLQAGGMPYGKAVAQASVMAQQQAAGATEQFKTQQAIQKQLALQALGQAKDPTQQKQILFSGLFAPEEINKLSQMLGADDELNQLLGENSPPQGLRPQIPISNGGPQTLAELTNMQSGAPSQNISQSGNTALPSDIKAQARILFKSGDKEGAIKLINEAKNPKPTIFEKELAKKDAETLQLARAGVEQLVPFQQALNTFKKNVSETPDVLFGPLAGKASPLFSDNAQAIRSDANTVTLLSRALLKMPAGNFSDADRDFLQNANVGLGISKEANKKVAARLEELVSQYINYTKTLEDRAAKTGQISGVAVEQFEKQFPNQSQSRNKPKYTPEQLDSLAKDAIAKGADPNAVRARIAELTGGQ
jgi:hypothetical protein